MMSDEPRTAPPPAITKVPSGIAGLDQITDGGLPHGRPTLVVVAPARARPCWVCSSSCAAPWTTASPESSCRSRRPPKSYPKLAPLGYDLPDLIQRDLLRIDSVHVERSEIEETGEYELEGLFIRLGHAIDSIGAGRVVLDAIEELFAGLLNHFILRAELRRLLHWLKERGVTAIVTGERGEDSLTRHGLEEYVADCVISLDQQLVDQVATRHLRVIKYRGSPHGTNEFPFLIGRDGLSVFPITSVRLESVASNDHVPTGVERLDTMLGAGGDFRGSTVLILGGAGTGKSSLAAAFADATCRRGERCLYLSFEESLSQVVRNMRVDWPGPAALDRSGQSAVPCASANHVRP